VKAVSDPEGQGDVRQHDHIMGASRAIEIDYLTSNNFAFGGINRSLIFRCV
jgi:3-oxoacyl-(acyl-carrier-protein) synthase